MDDRNFEEWVTENRPLGPYLTFNEYVSNVRKAGPSRIPEWEMLVKVFSLPILEQVLEGKRIIEARDFLKGKDDEKNNSDH